jgi:hypothetical protein
LRTVTRAPGIQRSNVIFDVRDGSLDLKPDLGIVPGCVVQHNKISRLLVVGEALCGVGKCNAVGNVVVRWPDVCGVSATKLEAVAITGEVGEAPSVEAIAP